MLVLGHKFYFLESQDDKPVCAFLVALAVAVEEGRKKHLILFMKKIRSIAMGEENLLFLVRKFSCDINP